MNESVGRKAGRKAETVSSEVSRNLVEQFGIGVSTVCG